MKKLYDIQHNYYCESGSGWFGVKEHHLHYANAYEFMELFGNSDPDLNLVFRWDWKVEDEITHDGIFYIYWIHQRKGYLLSAEFPVSERDESMLKEWLANRYKTIKELWNPVNE